MPMKLYNDLTRRKEEFVPLVPGEVRFYVCGPTVYDFFHIGNARPFIVFDVMRRYLESTGMKVIYVQNFTDIDDKMINRARELNITVSELADRFIEAYYEDADALGIRRATVNPKATEHIPEIIQLVERLVRTGHAYTVDGDVYFEVATFPEYGKLSKQTLEELQSGARIEVDERKKHPLDFALWKARKEGEPYWDSPWGPGRPGWHIECSAMAMKYLGETADIHAGGSDLIFPHHENEIAQAEAATGKPFIRTWVHNGYLLMDNEKMSKSLGNFLTARELRKRFSPLAIRLFMLSAHYRSPINFSDDSLRQATSAVERLRNCWALLQEAIASGETRGEAAPRLATEIKRNRERFRDEMEDDLNTAGALGALFEAVKAINSALRESPLPGLAELREAESFLREADEILGVLGIGKERESGLTDAEIENRIRERAELKRRKDFQGADAIRSELLEQGVILEDTPQGTRWKRQI
ncbi:MAG: cysteine--tRNA ligase [Synergistaceae bacterium]|nr:cysteine--tRNA ligase [Synergistaceae bacterium]